MLTIAIPTYDRNARLLRTLDALLPQVTAPCRVLILDNHSPTPVEETLRGSLARFPHVDCRVIRHPYNLGGHANFLRCFELCETEYLWLLGDDDPPLAGAVKTVLEHLERYPNAIYFNFTGRSHLCKRAETVTTKGLGELMDNIHDFGQMIWISVCVYKCAAIRGEIKFSSSYVQGICPQFLPVLRAAQDGAECHLSTVEIVQYDPPPATGSYSLVVIALASMMILDLPWPASVRRRLSDAIRKPFGLTPLRMTVKLHALVLAGNDPDDCLYWFDQIMSRTCYFHRGIFSPLQHRLLRLFLLYPHAGKRLIGAVRFVAGRTTPAEQATDIFNRA